MVKSKQIEIKFEGVQAVTGVNNVIPVLKKIITDYNFYLKSVSIIIISDLELLKINKQHLKHDYLTDIISFNYCSDNIIEGEEYISLERVVENAKIVDVDIIQELYRVMIHGVLHFVGEADKSEYEIVRMRKLEDKYLSFVSRET